MIYFYITGTSSGIGFSLAKQALAIGKVFGISRQNQIDHPNFTFLPLDLSSPEKETASFQFNFPSDCTQAVLINNAGIIGEIKPIGNLNSAHFTSVINTNFTSLCILSNQFLHEIKSKNIPGFILNISSGAAAHPIASWATYCASKAAVDMFSITLNEELQQNGISKIKCYSIYPGIVDTSMQEHIRASKNTDFPDKIRFEEYKNSGQLVDPDLVAEKIIAIFKESSKYTETIINLREH